MLDSAIGLPGVLYMLKALPACSGQHGGLPSSYQPRLNSGLNRVYFLADAVLRLTPDSPAAAVRTVNEVLKLEASTDLSDLVGHSVLLDMFLDTDTL
jgi:hypothetical protein